MNNLLYEITRKELIKKSKLQSPERILRSKKYSAKDFREVDFKKLFETDTFVWNAQVGDYIVTISFEGPFEELKWYVKSMRGPNRVNRLTQNIVAKALSNALDVEDIKVRCSCADFKYRMSFWCTKDDCIYGKKELRRPKYAHTNKNKDKGIICKHILSVLIGKRWVPSAAKAWLDYMRANPELTESFLWDMDIKREKQRQKKEKQKEQEKQAEEDTTNTPSEESPDNVEEA